VGPRPAIQERNSAIGAAMASATPSGTISFPVSASLTPAWSDASMSAVNTPPQSTNRDPWGATWLDQGPSRRAFRLAKVTVSFCAGHRRAALNSMKTIRGLALLCLTALLASVLVVAAPTPPPARADSVPTCPAGTALGAGKNCVVAPSPGQQSQTTVTPPVRSPGSQYVEQTFGIALSPQYHICPAGQIPYDQLPCTQNG